VPSIDFIRAYLADVRVRLRRQFAAAALYLLLAAWLTLATILPLVALALSPGRATSLALVAGAGLIGFLALVAAIVGGVWAPLKRFGTDDAVARWIGARHRPVASDLLSTVELARTADGPGAPSRVLIEALTDGTARRLKGVTRASLFDRRLERRAGAILGASAAAVAVVVTLAGAALADGWRTLLAPPARPWNGASLSSMPLVGDLTITLTPPAYTRRPASRLDATAGDFRALAGTSVTVTTTALEPAQTVTLLLERGPADAPSPPERVPLVAGPAGLAANFVVDGPARYRFELTTPRKPTRLELAARTIEVEPDQVPTVELFAPGDELDVTNMKRIELAYVAEDDFGVGAIELVWDIAGKVEKKPIAQLAEAPTRTQGKLVWDLAELSLPPGAVVSYHLEATDNDAIDGPNRGVSKPFRLRVFSPRERHEEHLARLATLAEHVVIALGARLVATDGEVDREGLHRGLDELAVEAGTLAAAFADDPLADPGLRAAITGVRDRLTKLVGAEERLLDKATTARGRPTGRLAPLDKQVVAELEDDAILLADWLEREQLEGMLDIADELEAHQKRLAELLAELARTGDPKLKAEIARELRAIEQRMAELARSRAGIAEDVLDQFVHADALADRQITSCMDEVEAAVAAGDAVGAQAALERCRTRTAAANQAMDDALHRLRGDRMGEAEQKLDQLMDELADLAADQTDIAAEADRIFERYAEHADALTRDLGKDAQHRLRGLVDKLEDRLASIPDSGLTPFAREELEIVDKRVDDLKRMLADGDVAEALGMAKQAADSLDTMASELDAAMADDPRSPFAEATGDAIDAVERARPLAAKLLDELGQLTPSPDQILGPDDKRRLDALRRRQAGNRDRARQLADKAAAADGLPGDAAPTIADKVGQASGAMGQAEKRMGARDPSGARDAARSAADALEGARREARRAARQAQSHGDGSLGDEPVRIPGADQYVAPEAFRQELLEGMKRKAPSGYDDQLRRYYEDLIR
jgi:hypothetical protein